MKIIYLFCVFCLFCGCSRDVDPIEDLVRQVEDLGGFVIRDESDRIIYINLASCQVPDTLIRQLPTLSYFQTLHLEYSNIENKDLKTIGQITSLRILNINETKTTDEGIFFLLPITHLEKLEMNHYSLTRPLPEELININIEDVVNGKVEVPKVQRNYGNGLKALVEKFPDLQVTLLGAMTWPGASQDD